MSGTNAIHGIVLVGGLLLLGLAGLDAFSKALLVIAVAFGTINVVGGFLVTDRMLEMFKSKPKPRGRGQADAAGSDRKHERGGAPAASDGGSLEHRRLGPAEAVSSPPPRDQLPAERKLHLRPVHRRLRPVHPGAARPRRTDDGGARQPHRRGRAWRSRSSRHC